MEGCVQVLFLTYTVGGLWGIYSTHPTNPQQHTYQGSIDLNSCMISWGTEIYLFKYIQNRIWRFGYTIWTLELTQLFLACQQFLSTGRQSNYLSVCSTLGFESSHSYEERRVVRGAIRANEDENIWSTKQPILTWMKRVSPSIFSRFSCIIIVRWQCHSIMIEWCGIT